MTTRDYLLQILSELFNGTDTKIKFLDFYQEGDEIILKVSATENGKYLEGSKLQEKLTYIENSLGDTYGIAVSAVCFIFFFFFFWSFWNGNENKIPKKKKNSKMLQSTTFLLKLIIL